MENETTLTPEVPAASAVYKTLTPAELALSLAHSGCTASALESALPAAFNEYRVAVSADADKATEKLVKSLWEVARSFSTALPADLRATLLHFRSIALMWHAVFPSDAKSACDLTKQAYKALFGSADVLELPPALAQPFFEFVADLLAASKAGTLLNNAALPVTPAAELESLGGYLAEAVGALNTHDAKSAHSSAQFQALFSSPATPSRYLSSSAFPVILGARSGGGPLKSATWLENVFRFRVSLEHKPFTILEALREPDIRAFLTAQGVTAWDALPVVSVKVTPSRLDQSPVVHIKTGVKPTEVVLVPSNAMLAATRELVERIGEKSSAALGRLYREALFEVVPESFHDVLDAEFSMEAYQDAVFSRGNGTKLVKIVNKFLKANGYRGAAVPDDLFSALWRQSAVYQIRQARDIAHVATVGSNPQNCGSAYLTYASRGIPRFPAGPVIRRKRSSIAVRRFHSVDAMLRDEVKAELGRQADSPLLEDKYQIGERLLSRRARAARRLAHLEVAVKAYARLIRRLTAQIDLTEDEKLGVDSPRLTPLQTYVLRGAGCSQNTLAALAEQGSVLLRSSDASVQNDFKAAVIARLQEVRA
ncbi:hypothetical protein KTD31_01970 [Burkholderia multivorans]|uniref:hypothetical protein n=1 Tax=Burkholderia multivorans TaxID=87883 RepID=UPI001C237D18|nr:hypothetical protein [Burkholderia multivorans]MBU9200171.1 hypothetical protein [Burkholderia multivorans]MDN8078707.1 hypothetical protein [Burkholderia multivorans]